MYVSFHSLLDSINDKRTSLNNKLIKSSCDSWHTTINAKFNYKNDVKNRSELWRCDSCMTAIDTQSHILWCPSYHTLRQGKDLNSDKDLVNYITKVFEIRENLKIKKIV